MPPTPSSDDEALREAAKQPAKASVDGQSVEQHSLKDQIEAELTRAAAGPPKREGRTGARITEYRVESFDGQETLTEYRGPMTEPFRTPHAVYVAVVKFAAGRKDPFDFMLLFDTLRKSLGELPDYRVRVCTRFMVAAGVLRHERRRFVAADGPQGLLKGRRGRLGCRGEVPADPVRTLSEKQSRHDWRRHPFGAEMPPRRFGRLGTPTQNEIEGRRFRPVLQAQTEDPRL